MSRRTRGDIKRMRSRFEENYYYKEEEEDKQLTFDEVNYLKAL